jgi:putative transcriptional regulator
VGVHYRTIGYLERGRYAPSLALAFRIARFLELPLDAVFSDRPFGRLSEQVYAAASWRSRR